MKYLYIFMFIVCLAPAVFSQAPRTISYQGVLLDQAGNALPDGQHQIAVSLFETQTGGTAAFSETFTVATKGGVFNCVLGSTKPIPANMLFDKQYYLATAVDGGNELSPRTILTSVPYAIHAAKAETAVSASTANALAAGATGVVTSLNGAEGALALQGGGGTSITRNGNTITISSSGGSSTGISGIQNGDGTLEVANPNGPVATIGIANNAVSTPKLADGAVSSDKLGNNSVNSTHLMMNAVTNDKIDNNAVSTNKLADGSVTSEKLGFHSVNSTHILMNAVTTTEIADKAVTNTKLAEMSVTPDKIDPFGAASGNVLTYDGANVVWRSVQPKAPMVDTIDAPVPGVWIKHNFGHAIMGQSPVNKVGVLGMLDDATTFFMNTGISGGAGAGTGVAGFSENGVGVRGGSSNGIAAEFAIGNPANLMPAIECYTLGNGTAMRVRAQGTGAGASIRSDGGTGLTVAAAGPNLVEVYSDPNALNLRFRVLATGDVRCDGAFTGGGADLAEAFDVEGNKTEYEPGDVLVISPGSDYKVMKSGEPNSTAVAGVYATKPGVLLAPTDAETEIESLVPLGMVGVIPTKVCAENGPIHRGDLLVTSSTPGHAMKAVPAMVGGVAIYPTGAILGKALENFDGDGTGKIKVLVNVK